MVQLFNHYSFLIFVVPVVLLFMFLLLQGKRSRLKQILALSLLVIVVAGFFIIQPGSNSMDSTQAQNLLVTAKMPILIEVYSDY